MCIEAGFIDHSHVECKKCRGVGTFELKPLANVTDNCILVCTNRVVKHEDSPFITRQCSQRMSPRTNSWFSQTKLTVYEVVLYTCMWYDKLPNAYIEALLHFSPTTTTDWASFCREAAIDFALDNSKQIGGPGTTVEIDECKASKSE